MRSLEPGTHVRIEHNAQIVGLADKENKYWYIVEYPEGKRETVSLARIHPVVDHTRAVMDIDCSIQIFSPRLSAEGALDLLLYLQTHESDFREAITPPPLVEETSQAIGYAPVGSNYHDHKCRCPGCDVQPPNA